MGTLQGNPCAGNLKGFLIWRQPGSSSCKHVGLLQDSHYGVPKWYQNHEEKDETEEIKEEEEGVAVPFLACGDLRDGDPDANYNLDPLVYEYLKPLQRPTAPAYKTALERAWMDGRQCKAVEERRSNR